MTGVGGDTGRGVRVAARSVRTWRRITDRVLIVALVFGLCTAGWKTWNAATAYEWHVMGVYALSEFLLAAGFHPDKIKRMRFEDGRVGIATIGDIAGHEPNLKLRDRILGEALRAGLLGLGVGAAGVVTGLLALRAVGSGLRRGRRLRGGELVPARDLKGRVTPLRHRVLDRMGLAAAGTYAIAGIPWPAEAETRHTIVSGTTGSGKTVLIADLVEQIRAKGERCVLYDKMGSYTETFFDPARDVLLNPLDARAPGWSPFIEARSARDFDTMAAALIPRQKDAADPFWITAARQLFSHGAAVLWQRGETRNRVLVDHLLKTELSALAEAMEGTVAQSIVDPENPKTALSVRAMLTANIGTMDLLPDEGKPFSIREWIERDGGGFLFLTSRGDQHASLRGLISTWLEIAVNALLSLPREDGRRIWLVLDELPTLHQLPSLRPGLAESRQFGGCFVLGVQVFSALRELYGRDGAETISGLCGTRVVLAAPDKDTSEWSAESLGRAEVESLAEGVSYDTPRDGVTLSARRDLRSLVLPAEVARLENLTGYLKFPGAWPVARIKLTYTARPRVAERFVPRKDGESGPHGGRGCGPHKDVKNEANESTTAADGRSVDENGAMPMEAADTGNAPATGGKAGESDAPEESVEDPQGESPSGWDDGEWAPHEWALCDSRVDSGPPGDEPGRPLADAGCSATGLQGAGSLNETETGQGDPASTGDGEAVDAGEATDGEPPLPVIRL